MVKRWVGRQIVDPEARGDVAFAAVLKGDQGVDFDPVEARIERREQFAVALGDDGPAHLSGPGELAVVGVELLVENQKPPDLRAGELGIAGESVVDLVDVTIFLNFIGSFL